MKTIDIVNEINLHFSEVYKSASKFVESGLLWSFCIDTVSNPEYLSNIVFANDLGIPPVKSLITIYERRYHPTIDFTATQSQYMGALMGFIFKNVLNYQNQKVRCTVNHLGVKSAARFYNGPIWNFEK